jgi:hypothetical protein
MALSSRVSNRLVDVMNTTFASIGYATGMKMPKCESNLATIAWEFFVAKHVLALATKRKDNAEKAAKEAGVLFDNEKDPHTPGRIVTFSGEVVGVIAEIKSPGQRVNIDLFAEHLIKAGVKRDFVYAAKDAATVTSRSAVSFIPYLVTTDGNGK